MSKNLRLSPESLPPSGWKSLPRWLRVVLIMVAMEIVVNVVTFAYSVVVGLQMLP